MSETLMTDDRERRDHINGLSEAHWRAWHREQDWINARTDELVASGMHWMPAMDQAIAEWNRGDA